MVAFLATILIVFNRFYIQKDYVFILEASCDSKTEVCFERVCGNPDDCPPNGFSNYKQYQISASDFEKCKSIGCKDECEQNSIDCKQIHCGVSREDSCTTFQ